MEKITCLEDRYLSSKITHNKGDFRGIPWENWEVVINFVAGHAPDFETRTYKKECATEKEAKKLESRALSIIQLAITKPDEEFFKQRLIIIE